MKKTILSIIILSTFSVQAAFVAIIGGEGSGVTYNVASDDPSGEIGQVIGDGQYVISKPTDSGSGENEQPNPDPDEPVNSCVGEELTREELRDLIGSGEDYSKACVSTITDFSRLFDGLTVDYDISNWDVSSGITFQYMFRNSVSFNQDISRWNVANGTNFSFMFEGATAFNQPLNDWNMSNSIYLMNMFKEASSFNQPLDKWDVSKAKYFSYMFEYTSAFNQNISGWDVSSSRSYPTSFSTGSALTSENSPSF
ncbi:BspA family leucine-rich repeat surface protein [Vibrio parahaemolyticus]|uniref:BspA family leucine-rich repeat surface protein n=1 Tax=Vibrio parahaemolyticus TaxID=670 RepID=UPI0004205CD6|nr:BspA family leucine-rich repeat surface protein [Vibrio parahaemolyticus]